MTAPTTRRWHLLAACATHPNPEWWTGSNPRQRADAAKVCQTCPVIRDCRREADELDACYGVWAGEVRG